MVRASCFSVLTGTTGIRRNLTGFEAYRRNRENAVPRPSLRQTQGEALTEASASPDGSE